MFFQIGSAELPKGKQFNGFATTEFVASPVISSIDHVRRGCDLVMDSWIASSIGGVPALRNSIDCEWAILNYCFDLLKALGVSCVYEV